MSVFPKSPPWYSPPFSLPHPPFILASSLLVPSAHRAGFGLGSDLQSRRSHPETGESHPAEEGQELDAPLPGFLVQVA